MANQPLSSESEEITSNSNMGDNGSCPPFDLQVSLFATDSKISTTNSSLPTSSSAVARPSDNTDEHKDLFSIGSIIPKEELNTSSTDNVLFPLTSLNSNLLEDSSQDREPFGLSSEEGLSFDSLNNPLSSNVIVNQQVPKDATSTSKVIGNLSGGSFLLPESEITHSSQNTTSAQSFAENYASLTAWTTKLTSQGIGQIPLPDKETMPIPLTGFSQRYIPSSTTTSSFTKPSPIKSPLHRSYSKIGPIEPSSKSVFAAMNKKDSLRDPSSNTCFSSMHSFTPNTSVNKEHRFKKTADALLKSGLWEVAMKTGNLIKRNRELQKELETFRADALLFLKSVIKNPHNKSFIKNVLMNAISASSDHHKRASVMSVIVSATASASVQFKKSPPSTHDSGISSSGNCGSQSDYSVSGSNLSCSYLDVTSPGSPTSHVPMDAE